MQSDTKTYPKTTNSKIISLEKGKIPPQAVDLEEAVIGAMMIDKKGVTEALEILNPDAFYDSRHQEIFNAISEVFKKSQPVDLLTVSNHLKSKAKLDAVGGDFYLIKLTQKVASSAHIDFHSRIILQKKIQRDVIKAASEMIEQGYSEETDVFDLIEFGYSKWNEISRVTSKKKEQKIGAVLPTVLDKARKLSTGEIKAGVPTPFPKLTKYDGGWRPTELIIIAARPGMGKTSMALSVALEPAKRGIPTAFFSMEMSSETLVSRLASMEFKIFNDKFTKKGISEYDEDNITSELDDVPMYIDDTSSITIEEFQIKANRMKSEHGIQLIVVDYIQLMKVANDKNKIREQQVAEISRGLKLVAKDLEIPVIALSQLSRAVETRGGSKRPLLSDLRESGAIEQDADIVSFIYRPEYYGLTEWDDDRTPCAGEADFMVAKNRNGGVFTLRFKFDERFTLFSDLEKEEFVSVKETLPTAEPEEAFDLDTQFNEETDDLPF